MNSIPPVKAIPVKSIGVRSGDVNQLDKLVIVGLEVAGHVGIARMVHDLRDAQGGVPGVKVASFRALHCPSTSVRALTMAPSGKVNGPSYLSAALADGTGRRAGVERTLSRVGAVQRIKHIAGRIDDQLEAFGNHAAVLVEYRCGQAGVQACRNELP